MGCRGDLLADSNQLSEGKAAIENCLNFINKKNIHHKSFEKFNNYICSSF